jgi:hypothetical protein
LNQPWVLTGDLDPVAMPQRMLPTDATGNPKPTAQRNFTDSDSHTLKGADGWIQGYNAQAAVDADHQNHRGDWREQLA